MKVLLILPLTIRKHLHIYHRGYNLWSCHNVMDALSYLLDNTYLHQNWKKVIQTNCWYSDGYKWCPLVADLILFCYERDFTTFLSDDHPADIIEAF